ncbi:S-adenosyl-L-methionine-dependent methyltransferase [Tribonema minus]|uniref:S-adenosyl-L-methionine-dependent methyltransferase n=1 Tax=Tribonema minus TaxID=303371 RepID=A0A835YS96_9STRA|nr:S-adenosyl-L-methionine-dependent methyltransferase [Tribonema minus]
MQDDPVVRAVAQARAFAQQGKQAQAIALWLDVLTSVPELRLELEDDLASSLQSYTQTLVRHGHKDKAKWLFGKAVEVAPGSCALLQHFGAYLVSTGDAAGGIDKLRQAIQADPSNLQALAALQSACGNAVDRWHFRMLNDTARNSAYARAIRRVMAARPGCTVLDIGAGTGLLSLMALRAGASRVYACETNAVLCQVAARAAAASGYQDRLTLLHSHSDALERGRDLPLGGVDVIVTELVDSGLLGERIVAVLRSAVRLLAGAGALVVPRGATVWVQLIESQETRNRTRCAIGPAPDSSCSAVVDERYTCERLQDLHHTPLTAPTQALSIQFLAPLPDNPSIVCLPVTASGTVDAIAVWFDMDLDGHTSVTTAPDDSSAQHRCSGWDQALFFVKADWRVQRGELVHLPCTYTDSSLRFPLHEPTALSTPLAATATAGTSPVLPAALPTYRLGEMDVARFNDERCCAASGRAIAAAVAGSKHVLDLSGGWWMSFTASTARACGASAVEVACTGAADEQVACLKNVLQQQEQRAALGAAPCAVRVHDDIGSALQEAATSVEVVVTELVEGSGLLRQGALEDLLHARRVCSRGSGRACVTVPCSLRMMVQGYSCGGLEEQRRVLADRTVDIDVSALNAFGVNVFGEMCLSQHTALTSVEASHDLLAVGGDQADSDAFIVLACSVSGTMNAVGFWYEMGLTPGEDGEVYSTYTYSSRHVDAGLPHDFTYFRQAAYLLTEPIDVVLGQQVEVHLRGPTGTILNVTT